MFKVQVYKNHTQKKKSYLFEKTNCFLTIYENLPLKSRIKIIWKYFYIKKTNFAKVYY